QATARRDHAEHVVGNAAVLVELALPSDLRTEEQLGYSVAGDVARRHGLRSVAEWILRERRQLHESWDVPPVATVRSHLVELLGVHHDVEHAVAVEIRQHRSGDEGICW